jgi:predicted RNA-binding Zn ribbon-like protein
VDETGRWPRSVGGHAALDFVNTDVVTGGDFANDVLRSAEELVSWCEYAGLGPMPTGRGLSRAQERALLAEATSLRGALRSIAEALAAGEAADPGALAELQSHYATAVRRASPALEGGRLAWSWDRSDPRAVLSILAVGAVGLMCDGPAGRLKQCPACGFVFLDATKNGSRRWCSMEDCGKQEKMRRYVAKRAQTRG